MTYIYLLGFNFFLSIINLWWIVVHNRIFQMRKNKCIPKVEVLKKISYLIK